MYLSLKPALTAGSVWKTPLKHLLPASEVRADVENVYYFRLLDSNGQLVTDPAFHLVGDYLDKVPSAKVEVGVLSRLKK